MNKLRTVAVLCLFFIALPLCAQTVKVNWQTGAPFSTYKTFAWRAPQKPGLPFYGAWVKADVIAELNSKGLTQAGPGQTPDVIATYHITGQQVLDATSNTDYDGFDAGPGPWGGGWGWYGGWGGWGGLETGEATTFTSTSPREMVILTIDLADAKQKKLIWRGQATVENASNSEKGDEKQTKSCVQKLFKSYPPKNK
jgi:Domain of unknown function (DUF4136)